MSRAEFAGQPQRTLVVSDTLESRTAVSIDPDTGIVKLKIAARTLDADKTVLMDFGKAILWKVRTREYISGHIQYSGAKGYTCQMSSDDNSFTKKLRHIRKYEPSQYQR